MHMESLIQRAEEILKGEKRNDDLCAVFQEMRRVWTGCRQRLFERETLRVREHLKLHPEFN